ncbi:hypothetical protein HHK36_014494 [Tetracentron sinense]|uniref:Uncharacterized protein n=1 Tax=Tetracentron sinense TaxID=13715 RepID=A0A834Z093_TETSI|nr:hypothetical protein HHK36_014494 [Tetracentron sinense]
MALRIIGYPNRLLTIHLVAKQIQDIKKRLKGISGNAETYGLNKQSGESSVASLNQVILPAKENRAPMVEEADVVGFHRDAEKLATLLVGGEARQNRSVVVFSMVEDAEIRAGGLIRLWIAEGFVQQRREERMEDVAEDYLEELIHRSLLQVGEKRSDGGVETCRIHDLLRDLAISEGKQDKFLDICVEPSSHRLAIHPVANGMYPTSSRLNLHSLLCFSSTEIDLWKSFRPFWGRIKLLRVLDLEDVSIDYLPDEIGELLLLKYLGLRRTNIHSLPPSTCNLRNLQTLDLGITNFSDIPNRLWKLKQLRHLYISYSNIEASNSNLSSRQIDNLSHLQTLELPAGNWIMGGLDKLTDLRQFSTHGKLSTVYKEALANSLPKLYSLRSLTLVNRVQELAPAFLPLVSFSQHLHLYKWYLRGQLEKLPNLVDFPPNLIELELINSRLRLRQQEDEDAPQAQNQIMAMLEQLPNLRFLFLGDGSYEEKEMIFTAGGFPKL